ncbi:MAG: hypothetical protein JW990_13955 [Thermoleophilia bacterium]|nr:hypothetical protein [Thermoleophilia bacterium]
MRSRVHPLLLVALCIMVLGVLAFAVACGEEETTTTAAPETTAAPATETTAAATSGTSGTMEVKGLVDNPMTLAVDDLKAMEVTTITAEHPKKGATEYTGVLLSDIMAAVKAQSGASVLNMGATDGYMGTVTLAELDPDSMISIGDDGTLNAVMPGQSGKAWVSDVVTLQFQ